MADATTMDIVNECRALLALSGASEMVGVTTRGLRTLLAQVTALHAERDRLKGELEAANQHVKIANEARHDAEQALGMKLTTRHGGNVGSTPFYLYPWQHEPEYDQADAIVVWYDDLVLKQTALTKAEAEAARLMAALEAALHDDAKYPQLRLPDMQRKRLEAALASSGTVPTVGEKETP